MSVLPDYTYLNRQGRGSITIRLGDFTQQPVEAVKLCSMLSEPLMEFTGRDAAICYVMFGVWMPPPAIPPDGGRRQLQAAVKELNQLQVAPHASTYLPAPPALAGTPPGHSLWMIGWPTTPSDELPPTI